MKKCASCSNPLPDTGQYVSCNGCNRDYHYGDCCGIAETTWAAKSGALKKRWRCEGYCRGSKGATLTTAQDTPDTPGQQQQERDQAQILDEINEKLEKLPKIEDSYKEIKKITENSEKTLQKIIQKMEEMEKTIREKDNEIEKLREKLNQVEQYSRNKNIEIHNVPETKGEKIEEIVTKITEKIGVTIKKEDIEACHRIGSRNKDKPKPIIVQFLSRRIRDQIIDGKQKNSATQDDAIKNGKTERIFVNENLSPENKEILYETKKVAKEKQYKFVWTRNGKILVRENEQGKVIQIKNVKDLQKL